MSDFQLNFYNFCREMAELECIKIRDNAFKDCHSEVYLSF